MGWAERARVLNPHQAPPGVQKVIVGYPCGGSVTVPFHASMLRLFAYEVIGKPPEKRHLAKMFHCSGLYVADNRTMLTDQFMDAEGKPEWLLQIDTDVEVPENVIERLLAKIQPGMLILAASVPLGEAYPTGAFKRADPPGAILPHWEALPRVPETPVPVDGIATACALIHREAFVRIARLGGRSWWQHMYLPKMIPPPADLLDLSYLSIGEDLGFCQKAVAAGVQPYAVHVRGLGHYKTRRLSHDNEIGHQEADSGRGRLIEDYEPQVAAGGQ